MKIGRPPRYKKEYSELAYNYCLLGATDNDLANFFDVSESTINNWKNNHKDFLESIKKGKNIADGQIAKSLFQRASGYSSDEISVTEDGEKTITKTTNKHYPAEVPAMIFWLKNRQPKLWRDKQEISTTNENNSNLKIELIDTGDKDV